MYQWTVPHLPEFICLMVHRTSDDHHLDRSSSSRRSPSRKFDHCLQCQDPPSNLKITTEFVCRTDPHFRGTKFDQTYKTVSFETALHQKLFPRIQNSSARAKSVYTELITATDCHVRQPLASLVLNMEFMNLTKRVIPNINIVG